MLSYLSYVKSVLGVQNFITPSEKIANNDLARPTLSPSLQQSLLTKKTLIMLALQKNSQEIDFEFLEKILASIKIGKSEFAVLSEDLLAQIDLRLYQGPVLLFGFSKQNLTGKFASDSQVWEFDSLFNISQDQKIKRQTWEKLKQLQGKIKH